ncbi:hypothetical protein [Confluentibacter sediminis]|nr:hypothetical protein [Confluentibacter sediminis]
MMFISVTEGLVKSLGNYLIEKQQIDISKLKNYPFFRFFSSAHTMGD